MQPEKKTLYQADYSKIILIKKGRVIKICKPKSFPRDYLRRYFYLSRAHREFRGAKQLNKIGLLTPKPISATIAISPFSKAESFYTMGFLDNHTLALNFAHTNKEIHFVTIIAEQFNKMVDNKICLKDFGMHNAMVSPDGQIVWIDTDIIKFFSKKSAQKYKMKKILSFNKKHKKHLSMEALDLFNQLVSGQP